MIMKRTASPRVKISAVRLRTEARTSLTAMARKARKELIRGGSGR